MEDLKVKYLSNKRTLLSVPGTLKTDAYFTEADSTVHLTELTSNLGRYVSSLSSNQFGSTAQVIIPNNDILGETYLHLQLPTNPGNSASSVWSACPGWGWASIKQISYLWGASNVAQISLSGKSLWAISLAQCDTAEKRSQLCYLGGSPSPVGSPSTSIDVNVESIDDDCYLPLALPWSVMCHSGKIGYDTSLLNSPITIQIQFAPREEFLGWASGISSTNYALIPTFFNKSEIVVRQQMFSDRSQSLKYDMQNDPTAVYNYPFKHYQSFQKDFSATATQSTTVQLTNFINADLIGMVVYVVRKSKLVGGARVGYGFSPLNISLPSDLRLLFNGQVLYNSPGKLYLLQNCAGLSGSGSYSVPKTVSTIAGGLLTNTSYLPIVRDMIFIDFSRKHSLCFEHEYENTFRIAQQTLDLALTLPVELGESTTDDYTLFATYIYNGVNSTQQGSSNIYFD